MNFRVVKLGCLCGMHLSYGVYRCIEDAIDNSEI